LDALRFALDALDDLLDELDDLPDLDMVEFVCWDWLSEDVDWLSVIEFGE